MQVNLHGSTAIVSSAETDGLNTVSRASSQLLCSSLDALTRMLLSGFGSSSNNVLLLLLLLFCTFEHQTCITTARTQSWTKAQRKKICASDRGKRRRNVSPSPLLPRSPGLAFHLCHFLVNASQIVTPSPFMLLQHKEGSDDSYTKKNLISWTLLPLLPPSLCFESL